MLLSQFSFLFGIRCLAFPIASLLFLCRWKSRQLKVNWIYCNIKPSDSLRFRLYFNAAIDGLELILNEYHHEILSRPQDKTKLLALKTKPCLFLSAHFHNWELMGSWLVVSQGVPLLSVALPLKNRLAHFFLNWLRSRTGVRVISERVPQLALRQLEEHKSFGMLWDQFPSAKNFSSTFFKNPVRMDPLPTFLYTQTHAAVFFGALLPSGTFRIINLGRPIHPEKIAVRYNRVLEILISQNPASWYGFTHRRFKDVLPY